MLPCCLAKGLFECFFSFLFSFFLFLAIKYQQDDFTIELHFLLNIFSYAAINSQLQELNHGLSLTNHWFRRLVNI